MAALCLLRNISMCIYQESVTDVRTDKQSDPYVRLCFAGDTIDIGSEMNFHFIQYLRNKLCDFISPSLWRGDIKQATSFINTIWNENSFQILFITCLNRKNVRKIHIYRVFLPILLQKISQCRVVTYDVIDKLRPLSLSKSCSALCHKLIYEIAMFHSINREKCDKPYF